MDVLGAQERRVHAALRRLGGEGVATFNPVTGTPRPLLGIFDREYVDVSLGIGMSGNNPAFTCATSDVPFAAEGDSLIIENRHIDGTPGTTAFTVTSPQPDGVGITLLVLAEVQT